MARARRLILTAVAVVTTTLAIGADPVAAHTDFESSVPADGDVVEGPVTEITITFTNPAAPSGDGFRALDPSGVVLEPASIATFDDGRVFVLGFDPPLGAGTVAVRWEVRAGDAHPIDGSFTFTVDAPAVTTTIAPASTVPPAATTPLATDATEAPAAVTTPTTESPATVPPTTDAATASGATAPGDGATGGTTIEEFLAGDPTSTAGDGRQSLGRIVSFLGLLVAVGGLAFLATAMTGSRREIAAALAAIAALGVAASIGSLIEYSGFVASSDDTFGGAWTSNPGRAMGLRFLGGLALAVGTVLAAGTAARNVPRALSAALDTERIDATVPSVGAEDHRRRWRVGTAPLAAVGAGLLVISFWFDGHTVSRGPRPAHALVNSVHVAAAAIWAGGVIALAALLWWRHSRGVNGDPAGLIVRFSSTATIALVGVVAAGVVMAAFVVDEPGDLTSTDWGRVLLLKTAAVGLIALMGGYNHFRLRPAFADRPDDPRLATDFRRTLLAEAVLFVFVIAVTASLVAAAV